MKTLQISEEKAKELYLGASQDFKSLLEENFGKSFFVTNVMDRINGWKDMLNETGRPDVPEFTELPEDLRLFFKAVYKNVVMVEAYNESEKMELYDETKPRHYPWFRPNGSPAGFRFCGSDFVNARADAGSWSRLSFKSSDLSEHAGKKHADFYREMLEY